VTPRQNIIPCISTFRHDGAGFLIRDGAVHVWSLRLDLDRETQDRLEDVISAEETARAERLVRAADRRRSAAAHGLLRVVLSGYLGVRPDGIALETGAGGKPRLADREEPRFNLSHAGARGLVAVSAGREVGIDIEEVREVGDMERLAARCFSPVERLALAAVPAPERRGAFFAGWTRKEAFLKARGEGLSRPLDSFDVTLAPGEPPRLLRLEGVPGAPARYTVRALRPAPGYVGALAVDGPATTIHYRPWTALSALLEETLFPHREVESAGLHPTAESAQ
jgi:4'-phosphopantetheinyl transferase